MSDMREGNLYHGNLHCVYNITSDKGYVNLTNIQLSYIEMNHGHLIISTSRLHCPLGGVALEMHQLCNNYTSQWQIVDWCCGWFHRWCGISYLFI